MAATHDLNRDWLFGGPYVQGSELPDHPEGGFTRVALPHTVTPLSWGDWDHARWEELWIYRRHLEVEERLPSRAFLDFDGVMAGATVYLNGRRVGQHHGGYLPWSAELTGGLAPGDNVLAVAVDSRWLDVPPNNPDGARSIDYLQPGGIYRDVRLRLVPGTFIADVFAKPINVLEPTPGMAIQVTLDADAPLGRPLELTAELMDGSAVVGSARASATIQRHGQMRVRLSISGLEGITLWSPDDPRLYQVRVSLRGFEPHQVTVTTGFREARFEAGGFYLNGRRQQIFGLNRHQLFPYIGMAAPARLQRRDAELLKRELNCNMVRCSHYPQSPHFLDACDELGLMVWQEAPGWGYVGQASFRRLVLENVRDMIVRDRNRPSIVMWGTRLNETSPCPSLYRQTHRLAHDLDGTRPTTGALTTQSTEGSTEDVFAFDDYHSSEGEAALLPPVRGVPYIVSEAVGALSGAPKYRWVDSTRTLATQARMHAQVHDIARSNSDYIGLLGWAAIDYASLNGGERIWRNMKWPGVLDTFRIPKPGAAFYRSQVSPAVKPVILPVFFWDFGPRSPADGPGRGAMIATNCERLEIYLDDGHLTTATPDRRSYPNLAYPPVAVDLNVRGDGHPELRIDGYVAGALVTSVGMSSDPAKDRLELTLEDAVIGADGSDATRLSFRAVDAYGNQRPYIGGEVSLDIAGPAELIGDNPFPFAAFGGVGGSFVRSLAAQTGVVTVGASHPTLGQATGRLEVVEAFGDHG